MTIRKTWNLWRFIIMPGVFFILGYIGIVVLKGAWWMSIVCLLWVVVALLYLIPQRCKCTKCKHPTRFDKYKELSMFTAYWPYNVKLKCKRCGELLE